MYNIFRVFFNTKNHSVFKKNDFLNFLNIYRPASSEAVRNSHINGRSSMAELTLAQNVVCGYFDCRKFAGMNVSPKRKVTCYEVEYYTDDGKNTYIDGKKYKIQKDFILIGKPGQIRNSELPFRTVFLKFDATGVIADMLSSMPDYFYAVHSARIKNLMSEIISVCESGAGDDILLHGKMLLLLSVLRDDARLPDSIPSGTFERLACARRFMDTHFSDKVTDSQIAAEAFMSESYFRSVFKRAFGYSAHKYLLDVRIAAAKKLLWNEDMPISDIAEQCGFGCQQYLCDVFRRETGSSPTAYRKELHGKYVL